MPDSEIEIGKSKSPSVNRIHTRQAALQLVYKMGHYFSDTRYDFEETVCSRSLDPFDEVSRVTVTI